jgi:hypothetical protein
MLKIYTGEMLNTGSILGDFPGITAFIGSNLGPFPGIIGFTGSNLMRFSGVWGLPVVSILVKLLIVRVLCFFWMMERCFLGFVMNCALTG